MEGSSVKIIAALFLVCTCCATLFAQHQAPAQPNNSAASQAATGVQKSADSLAVQAAAIDPAKEAAIRKLFEVICTKDLVNQTVATMSDKIKPLLTSSLPPGEYRAELIDLFFQRFQAKFKSDQFLALSIPVYDKHFPLEEIEGLIKFYETPLGKKAGSVLPQVLNECQALGSKWGEELGRQTMIEIMEERPDLKKSLEAAAAGRKDP
jgi:hypothetical protein